MCEVLLLLVRAACVRDCNVINRYTHEKCEGNHFFIENGTIFYVVVVVVGWCPRVADVEVEGISAAQHEIAS